MARRIWREPGINFMPSESASQPRMGDQAAAERNGAIAFAARLRATSPAARSHTNLFRRFRRHLAYYLWRASDACPSNGSRRTRPRSRDPHGAASGLARVFGAWSRAPSASCCRFPAIMAAAHGREHNGKAQNGHGGRWRQWARGSRARRSCYLIPGDSPSATANCPARFAALGRRRRTRSFHAPSPDPMAPHPDLPPLEAFRPRPAPAPPGSPGASLETQRRRRSAPARRGGAHWAPDLAGKRETARPPTAICAQAMAFETARRPPLLSSCRHGTHPIMLRIDLVTAVSRGRATPPKNSASRSSLKAIRRPAAIRACSISA